MASAGEGTQVAGADQQRGAQERPEAGHGLNDLCLRVLGEGFLDSGIKDFQSFVEREDATG
jgi:hypothetical protein